MLVSGGLTSLQARGELSGSPSELVVGVLVVHLRQHPVLSPGLREIDVVR